MAARRSAGGGRGVVLLVMILADDEVLEEILEAFLELGITGATVLDAHGMGEILARNVPIFAGLRGLFPGAEHSRHLVLSVCDRARAREAVAILRDIGRLEQRGTGIALTLPVEETWGLAREL